MKARSYIILNESLFNQRDVHQPVCFFDMDNTLYPKSTRVGQLMAERIRLYFQSFLGLPEDESRTLGCRYYNDYGLAIRGAIQDFRIDPAHYDSFVDGGLPLEELLHASSRVNDMLRRMNCRRWVFTNAGM